ncbi:trimeric intracellular cation channel family protein [Peptoniphilus sp. MSJ-1]|uniref:Trimeric intracellular cation channel family protein n=1 Tax=Peptoniphilus ovalis TaxID=2841503 RepID=A0ABS6FIA5_9FIRM|nr:trimeric intracellular cation channel family protein [Peptoniphilus ovalis]MBU5669227.1 trimeric intracellular cation channel family protein [Peptoniphilus ovalis]
MNGNYLDLNVIFDIIGTIAFAISGAILGARKNMDILGVIVLGLVTALGGGFVRDLVLGINPPKMFQDSTNAIISTISAVIVFLYYSIRLDIINRNWIKSMNSLMTIFDTIGLASFTITGISTALSLGYDKKFLLIFVGTITGVGGGMIRDVLSGSIPFIFKEQIYAGACILGAIVFIICYNFLNYEASMIISFFAVLIIRLIAVKRNWNLPKISN